MGWPKGRTGVSHPRFRGGLTRNPQGYIRITASWARGSYLHRWIAEKLLGAPLPPGFEIHHLDWQRDNPCPFNLLILDGPLHRGITPTIPKGTREIKRGPVNLESLCRHVSALIGLTFMPAAESSGSPREVAA